MKLSIVIPVYNEEKKISADIREAGKFILDNGLAGDIMVVDDGSTDKTRDVIFEQKHLFPLEPVVVSLASNRGKGYAVKQGMLKSGSGLKLFIDSGNCIPYDQIMRGIELIRSGKCDIAHGSRYLPESHIVRKKNWFRRVLTWMFRRFIIRWMHIPSHLSDTQCGLKIYKKEVADKLFDECETDGFLFDIEIILRAEQAGYRIKEFPVTWTSDPDSRLSLSKNFFRILKELTAIKRKF